jgi:hypothetical protein
VPLVKLIMLLPAAELSVPLRTELVLYLYRSTIRHINWFKGKDRLFTATIVPRLNVEYFAPVRPPVLRPSRSIAMLALLVWVEAVWMN